MAADIGRDEEQCQPITTAWTCWTNHRCCRYQ